MPLRFEHKQWDSDFFGFQVAELLGEGSKTELETICKKLKEHNYHLAYWRVDPADSVSNFSAENLHALLADTRMIFSKSIDETYEEETTVPVENYKGKVNDELISLTLQSGEFSRFKNDTKFPAGTFEKLYTVWMINSLEKNYVKEIFVVRDGKKIVGFVSVGEIHSDRAEIDQIAVDKDYRGKNFGKQLVHAAVHWAQKNKYKEMQVATQQRNVAACKFYEACNFRLEAQKNFYHFWL